ncbi:MAG: deoxyribose-phosphate aldolase [Vicinamibacterales bacterium]
MTGPIRPELARVASLIDHTLLKPDATRRHIDQLCDEAAHSGFATVCVNPVWVGLCTTRLSATPVVVCSVVGFPLGATTGDVKVFEATRVIAHGARELDMVIDIGALRNGEWLVVERDISAVAAVCGAAAARLKVIIETALLTEAEKVAACQIAVGAGADFVKTSTGFWPGGATVADVRLMRQTVGPAVGVKAAGGIRDLATLRAMVDAGATRIGCSASLAILSEMGDTSA